MKQATKKEGKQRKIDAVKAIGEKLARTKALFLTDYRGLTHKELEHLRRLLKKVEAEFVVSKNTLFQRAIAEWNKGIADKMKDKLKEQTATLFAYGDEIAAIKELATFMKTAQLLKIKIGFFAGSIASADDFSRLAALPTRNILLATLGARMMGPLSGLHYSLRWNLQKFVTVLDNVKGKKPSN